MAGVIRWRDLQNIFVTEDQINLLAGLTAEAADLNRITGFIYNGAQLNSAYEAVATLNAHIAQSLGHAHAPLANSLDGGVLVNGTVELSKLAFTAMTSTDDLRITGSLDGLQTDLDQLTSQVETLYSIVLPGQANDIAESIAQMVLHIQKLEDAHDASAISFGNEFTALMNTVTGTTQARVSMADIRFVRIGDIAELKSTAFGPEVVTVNSVNYNTGHIGFSSPVAGDYRTTDSFVIKIKTQANTQQAIARSLRNTTDSFNGRLTIEQTSATDSAIVVTHTGPNYTAQFNNLNAKSFQDWKIQLGNNNGSTLFNVRNTDERIALQVLDNGELSTNNVSLLDYGTLQAGKITKQPLTAARTWTLPDRSGFVGVGDLTFTELLKVSVNQSTKSISIAPGFKTDYTGQKVSAWISMEYPCKFPGGSINLQTRMSAEGQLISLANKWQVVVPYIDDQDNIGFQYGPQEDTKQEALDEYENFIPSAFMKLALMVVQGDNVGGILSSSIEIIEDQRPILSMGLSAAYYDEEIFYASGLAVGTVVNLPPNSRAGGQPMTYQPGRGQLEIYIDGVYQKVDTDYEETQGTPIGRIRVLKPIASHSRLRFRVTFKAAAIVGGIDVETLQTVYQGGRNIFLSEIYGPITMSSYDIDTLMDIAGSIVVTGMLRSTKGIEFTKWGSAPGDAQLNHLWVNNDSKLIFHQYRNGFEKDIDLLQEIVFAQEANLTEVNNMTGQPIPKGKAVALHPSLTNHIVLCDTSSLLSISRVVGVTVENIPSGGTGKIILNGNFANSGLTIPHKKVVVVDPRNPGKLVDKDTVVFLPADSYMEVGVMNGSNLIIQINTNKPADDVWRTAVAGEAFNQNETRIVRFGLFGETRGAVYKATKENANIDQKFWAFAAVRPQFSAVAGDNLNLYVDITLHASETQFDDQDIGLPLYLATDGTVKPWRTIKSTYALGDAIVKIGIIEDRNKFVIKDVQMMGTAPGPMV